ncbi:radical SAM protein [Cohnella xylanilytica]|uniref:radical SAM protein n=1 Tax=Cohnella xylanilytica TaxID=557555 RepID=UPI001AFE5A50|nr:radical SAM protein [Cohnella xylanilytica]GIO13161.1 radical SAM protein [Cohnella xylanilytica]
MQPKSNVMLEEDDYELVKRTIRNVAVPYRESFKNPRYKTPLPESVGVKLTNRCNLRCIHCFEWNEEGYHQQMDREEQNKDLDIELFRKILNETSHVKSRLYLWGGEPMIHRQFGEIMAMMQEDPRETTICTNGLLIDRFLQPILDYSPHLELLFGIEGLEKEHDLIRGKGTFKKTIQQMDRLIELREQGQYQGRISVHTVINDDMIPKLYDLLEWFESKKLDLVILCFPWYISKETSLKMDDYFASKFGWLRKLEEKHIASWHAFKYQMNPDHSEALVEQLKRINDRMWNIRIRYQPGLDYDEIRQFLHGDEMQSRCSSKCLAIATRMDVGPTGEVTACKFFNEFKVGNLKESSISEVWDSDDYDRIREIINVEGLTPVCSKCSLLYLHGG